MQRLHPLAGRAFLRDLHDDRLADAKLRARLLRKVEPFDQQIRPPLEPRHRSAARFSGRSPVAGFDEHDCRSGPESRLYVCRGNRLRRPGLRSARPGRGPPSARAAGRAERCRRSGPSSRASPSRLAVSTMRFEKPHSLSYQLTTRTSLPSSTAVSRLSTVELAGVWTMSIETSGSSLYSRMPFEAAAFARGLERRIDLVAASCRASGVKVRSTSSRRAPARGSPSRRACP